MSRFSLSRRTFLRGLGAAIALPALEAMFDGNGLAWADGTKPPVRLVVWWWGNGVRLDRWVPTGTGTNWVPSEALAPLANVKDYVNVCTGFVAKAGYGRRGHHDGTAAMMSATPFIALDHPTSAYASKFAAPSIDQIAAQKIGQTTLFPSLEIGVSKRIVTGEGPTLQCISHKGPDSPVPSETNPAQVFNRLFSTFPHTGNGDPQDMLRVNVLDAVREDAKRLSQKLGKADRARLDEHLTGISELRRRILAATPMGGMSPACTKPLPVTDTNADDADGNERLTTVNGIMSDLLVMAFACDLTRVATVLFSGGSGGTVFNEVGASRGIHDMTHDSSANDMVHKAVVYMAGQFASFAEKLKKTPEGAGNLLDQSTIMWTTDVAEGLTHSSENYPVAVVGRGGGFFKYPGVHYASTTKENTSDIVLSVMQSVGTGLVEIGKDQGYSNTPCRPIMA